MEPQILALGASQIGDTSSNTLNCSCLLCCDAQQSLILSSVNCELSERRVCGVMDALPLPPPGHDVGDLRDVVIKALNGLEKILNQRQKSNFGREL